MMIRLTRGQTVRTVRRIRNDDELTCRRQRTKPARVSRLGARIGRQTTTLGKTLTDRHAIAGQLRRREKSGEYRVRDNTVWRGVYVRRDRRWTAGRVDSTTRQSVFRLRARYRTRRAND